MPKLTAVLNNPTKKYFISVKLKIFDNKLILKNSYIFMSIEIINYIKINTSQN